VEPLSIGIYASRFLNKDTDSVAILGCGPIGLSVLLACKDMGIKRIFSTEKLPYRGAAASALHAEYVGNPEEVDIVGQILALVPHGLSAVFECAGQQDSIDQGLELLRPGGQLILLGIPEEKGVRIDPHMCRRKEIRIQNVRRQNGCVEETIKKIARGKIEVDFMITHTFSLHDTAKAFELVENYADNVLKAIIHI
jgi:threonine dehydrogenase-like Zn-dependent dehydrogenase